MRLNRREFVILTSALVCGCQENGGVGGKELVSRDVDAGPIDDLAPEGIIERFRDQGFFLIRRGGKLVALSAICTHRYCKLNSLPDRSFVCKCHGSTFDAAGQVTTGPAKRDLPVFATSVDDRRHLIVHVGTVVVPIASR